jgi:hypothetical protein
MKKILALLPVLAFLAVACSDGTTSVDVLDPDLNPLFATSLYDATTTWNVTPVSKTFPTDRACPAGSYLVQDQFQSVTENVETGTFPIIYTLDGKEVTVTIDVYADNSFDFHIVGGVTPQMFVKGGTGSEYLLYQYQPPVAGATNTGPVSYDTGLHDGFVSGDTYQDISHLDFCLIPYEPLQVEKTAAGTYGRTIEWVLEKSVAPASHSGFIGQTAGSSTWTVVATKSETLGDYKVEGTITITNPNDISVEFSVSDILDDGTVAVVTCPTTADNTGTVPANDWLVCDYEALPEDESAELNIAAVTVTTPGIPEADPATAGITWNETLDGFDEGTLSDERFEFSELISATTTETFPEEFTCSADQTDYTDGHYQYTVTNWAYLNDNIDLEDSATVTVDCYAPVVTKDALASYDKTHTWDIEKSVDPTSQSGYPGDVLPWTWTVTVSESDEEDNFAVSGKIYVQNPHPTEALTVSVADALNDGTDATVDCGSGSTSLTVACGATGECSLLGGTDRENRHPQHRHRDLQLHRLHGHGPGIVRGERHQRHGERHDDQERLAWTSPSRPETVPGRGPSPTATPALPTPQLMAPTAPIPARWTTPRR